VTVIDLLEKSGGEGLFVSRTARQKCPECVGNHSLSVPNEEFAKCFRCGNVWSTAGADPVSFWVSAVLAKLADACYRALTSEQGKRAKGYLHRRHIEAEVVRAAPIGVVPHDLNVGRLLSLLNTTYERIRMDVPEKPARRADDDILRHFDLKQQAKQFEQAYTSLKAGFTTLSSCGGWLALFYSNEEGLCSVKLRNVETGEYKKIGTGGVFWPETEEQGYSNTWLELMDQIGDKEIQPTFLAFEGEFNLLQWHSAMWRVDAALGRTWVPNPGCALGGSTGWDIATLMQICKDPLINADNDDPGIEAVKSAVKQGRTPLRYFTLRPAKDMDEYLRDMPTNEVVEKLLDVFENVDVMCRELDDVRDEINEVLGKKAERLNTQTAVKIIWKDLTSRGKFYWTKISHLDISVFFWNRRTGELVYVERDHKSIWWKTLLARYGVMSRESFAKQMIYSIIEQSFIEGIQAKIHSLAYYDRNKNTCYINLGDSRLAIVTRDDIEESHNGCDGVLFLSDTMTPVTVLKDQARPEKIIEGDSPTTMMLARSNIPEEGAVISGEGYRHILMGRILSLFFKEIISEKPIMAVIGEYNSGKTEVVRQIGLSLFGEKYKPVMVNQQDRKNLEALLTTKDFVHLDNLDESVEPDSLNILSVAVTGGALSMRRLYSDSENLEMDLKANLFVTAQTMPWVRGDVLSRTIQIPVDKLPAQRILSSDRLRRIVLEERNAVFTDLIFRVQKALEFTPDLESFPTGFRLRGLSDFVVTMSDVTKRQQVVDWFDALALDDKTQVQEGSTIFQRLQEIEGLHAAVIRQCQLEGEPWKFGLRKLCERLDENVPINQRVKSQQAVKRFIQQNAAMLKKELGFSLEKDNELNTWQYHFNPSEATLCRCELIVRGGKSKYNRADPEDLLEDDLSSGKVN
jgi:hypothetical protein